MDESKISNSISAGQYFLANLSSLAVSLWALRPSFFIVFLTFQKYFQTPAERASDFGMMAPQLYGIMGALIICCLLGWIVSLVFYVVFRKRKGRKILLFITPITYTLTLIVLTLFIYLNTPH